MTNTENIERLFQRFLDDKCTRAEVNRLLQYFDAGENEALLRSLIEKQSEPGSDTPVSSASLQPLLDVAFIKIQSKIAGDTGARPAPVVSLYRRFMWRMSVAGAVIFLISIAAIYFIYHNKGSVTAQTQNAIPQMKDVPPGTYHAILTLDNGRTIVLDSTANGTLAEQGGIKVLKRNGEIAYNSTGGVQQEAVPIYNTITTARGNEYRVVLADGSKVWLNAASSIRFPAYFTGNERKVEITGEAYFEVAPLAAEATHGKVPFIVSVRSPLGDRRGMEIEVTGTRFNVNAYAEEPGIKTTLIEGSVKIKGANELHTLSPGQQAELTSTEIILRKNVDVSQVAGWKEGFFVFDNTDLQALMLELSRWYDVDVNFEGKISREGFSGKISRNVPLSKLLKVLELNDVHVTTEGRRITVTQ